MPQRCHILPLGAWLYFSYCEHRAKIAERHACAWWAGDMQPRKHHKKLLPYMKPCSVRQARAREICRIIAWHLCGRTRLPLCEIAESSKSQVKDALVGAGLL